MTRRSSRTLASLVLLSMLASGLWLASTAEAAHRSFRYTGHCYGFPGEAEMLAALNHMDVALAAPCRQTRMQAIHAARQDVLRAQRRVTCPHARRELVRAVGPLNLFGITGDYYRLDEASQRIMQALEMERLVHARLSRSVHGYRGPYGQHTSFGHGGPGRVAPGIVSPGFAVPVVQPGHHRHVAPVPVRPAAVQIGGPRFSIGFSF